jgi:hypothetical protein
MVRPGQFFQAMYYIARGGGGAVGNVVGTAVGAAVGTVVGIVVGVTVGTVVGAVVGAAVGAFVGATVGAQTRPRFVQDWVGVTPFFWSISSWSAFLINAATHRIF